MTAPDLTQKVLGYRQFGVADGSLHAIGIGAYHWLPGPNKARCLARLLHSQRPGSGAYGYVWFGGGPPPPPPPPPARHDAPQPGCECGFYAYHEMPDRWLDGHLIGTSGPAAVVLGWGRMEVHRTGFRSEWAEIAMLGYDPLIGVKAIRRIERVAKHYGVPAISVLDFPEIAPTLGSPCPADLFPVPDEKPAAAPLPSPSPMLLPAGSTYQITFSSNTGAEVTAETPEQPAEPPRTSRRRAYMLPAVWYAIAATEASISLLTGAPLLGAAIGLAVIATVALLVIWSRRTK